MLKSMGITFMVLCLAAVYAQGPVADARCPAGVPAAPLLFPHPTDCSLFLSCSNGFAFTLACQAGHYFHPTALQCRLAHTVDCTSAPTTPTTTTTTTTTTTLAPGATDPAPIVTDPAPVVTDPAPIVTPAPEDTTTTTTTTLAPDTSAPAPGGTPAPVIPPQPPVIP